ncbi:ABC transporter ATP-binding protein [Halarsenatibacter silvermanii]|uniref:Branched-chain amino acid transport system ATP-binding protein n=1 Tax=Halarsenatibacter silvermanii TaxID=321763 RepID=A0A1G9I5J2_9FIRM|nr:ABC transporter ATP-binding protein [Halarsenatibacter silvermanii]SDL20518.1 branched-chain amino acid transport system ATP-binding protein [Halarsenatibacter silvermanii]
MSDNSFLSVEDVTSGYGMIEVLFDISMEVEKGQFVVLIGPNGAGKTTLLRSIMGIVPPQKGRVYHSGDDVTDLNPEQMLQRNISYVPQERNIFAEMSVEDNLEMGAYSYEGDPEERLELIFQVFPILKERLDQEAGTLSGGQRQMLAISRGIMMEPELLILDEPTSGLQPNLVTDVMDSIVELQEKDDMTILLVAQTDQAIREADFGYLIRSGEIVLGTEGDKLLESDEVMDLYFGG